MENNKESKMIDRGNSVQQNNKAKNIWQRAFSRENGNDLRLAIYNIRFCDQCDKTFKTKESLRLHVKSVHEGVVFKCTKCDRSYGNLDNLKRHIGGVHDGIIFKCDICGKDFKHKSVLKIHTERHNETKLDCKLKPKAEFHKNRNNLSVHRNKELEKKKEILTKETHITHSTIQVGHEEYNCEFCGKSISRRDNLMKHIHTIHKGHKDYKCESCGKSFSDASNFMRHIHTIHEGHKDYNCESCGKSFSEAQNLKRHIHTVHKGQKDYKCKSCGKSFTTSNYLKKHNHTIHEGH